MTKYNYLLLAFILLFAGNIHAQSDGTINREKIAAGLTTFFKPDRENIHLHLNKTVYVNDEKIWFKGYIIEKKTASPYGATSNVYVRLLNEQGNVINTILYYAENSTFSGFMPLDLSYQTGTYYLQVYTNYMNNFADDESTVHKIAIVNPIENKIVNTKKINYNTIDVAFTPESGVFVQGTSNTIGIKIADCNDNGIAVKNGAIHDPAGNVVATFSTNQFGYGKFDILSTENVLYRAVFEVNGKVAEKPLPLPVASGIALSVNNYALIDKTVIKIKTNSATIGQIVNRTHALVIQKADAFAAIDVSFSADKLEQTIILPSSEILEGISTIYLIDQNLKKIAERVIYTPFAPTSITTLSMVSKSGDSIRFIGVSPLQLGTLSISALPGQTLSEPSENNIYNSLLLDNYLSTPTKNAAYFINDFDRKKHYELDNILLSKTSKYSWDTLVSNLPQPTQFDFDSGLTIKGTINTPIDNVKDYKIQMSSIYLGLEQFTTLNDKKEFLFNNVMAVDSSTIYFSLINKKGKLESLKMFPQLLNNNRKFSKSFKVPPSLCGFGTQVELSEISFPTAPGVILLDDVALKGKTAKRDTLLHNRRWGNNMARAYKIDQNKIMLYQDILGFIRGNGYDVTIDGANVNIVSRSVRSLRPSSPQIYMDDVPYTDANQLLNYKLTDIDEIYINRSGFGGSGNSIGGVIRIYTKRGHGTVRDIKINSQSLLVINGFQPYAEFENQKYDSVHTAGFQNFGTIHWIPEINTDETGTFRFSIPNLGQKKVRFHIEGIATDGKVVSETIYIDIK